MRSRPDRARNRARAGSARARRRVSDRRRSYSTTGSNAARGRSTALGFPPKGVAGDTTDAEGPVRTRIGSAAGEARRHAGVGAAVGRAGRGDLRGAGCRRQGFHDQAGHGVPEPPGHAHRGAADAERARQDPVVLPAVRAAPARSGRDRALRSLLVQPRRRRTGHGVLHERGVPAIPAPGAGRAGQTGPT